VLPFIAKDGGDCIDGSELPAVTVMIPPLAVSVMAPPDCSQPFTPLSKCHSIPEFHPKPDCFTAGRTLNSAKILPWRAELVTE
jgi:hypothetical protein